MSIISQINSTTIDHVKLLKWITQTKSLIQDETKCLKYTYEYMYFMCSGNFKKLNQFQFIRQIISNGETNTSDFLTELAQYYKISDECKNEILLWFLLKLNEIQSDIKTINQSETHIYKIFRTMFGFILYMVNTIDHQTIKTNFKNYICGIFYVSIAYLLDDLIDQDIMKPFELKEIDNLISQLTLENPIIHDEIENPSPILQLFRKWYYEFNQHFKTFPNSNRLKQIFQRLHQAQIDDNYAKNTDNAILFQMKLDKSYYTQLTIPYFFNIEPSKDNLTILQVVAVMEQLFDDYNDRDEDRLLGKQTFFTENDKVITGIELILKCTIFLIKNTPNKYKQHHLIKLCQIINYNDLTSYECLKTEGLLKYPKYYQLLDSIRIFNQSVSMNIDRTLIKQFESENNKLSTLYQTHMQNMVSMTINGNNPLCVTMNYSLNGGKNQRSFIAYLFALEYQIDSQILPFLKACEYCQTSSLIFDDLPAQDNATLRRNNICTHLQFPEYQAQLGGLGLIMDSFREISDSHFNSDLKIELISYLSKSMGHTGLCLGQLIDLQNNNTNLSQFLNMYYLKTSLAFEIPMYGVAILAKAKNREVIKRLAYHLGIAYQIKDDLLELSSHDKISIRVAKKITDIISQPECQKLYNYHRSECLKCLIKLSPLKLFDQIVQLIFKILT